MSSRYPMDPTGALERQEREQRGALEVRYSSPVTRSLPKAERHPGLGRDLQIIEACMKASGELVGKSRRETDAEIKGLRAELEALRQEVAALRQAQGPSLRSVA